MTPSSRNATPQMNSTVVVTAPSHGAVIVTLRTPRAVVVLHYSPVLETVRGEPAEIMPFLGCSRLAETIDRFVTRFGSPIIEGERATFLYRGDVDEA